MLLFFCLKRANARSVGHAFISSKRFGHIFGPFAFIGTMTLESMTLEAMTPVFSSILARHFYL
jgi:hypothetical protein